MKLNSFNCKSETWTLKKTNECWKSFNDQRTRYQVKALENQIAKICRSLLEEREQFAIQLTEEQEQHEIQVRKEREQSKIQVGKQREQFSIEREADRKLMASIHDLQAELSKYQS